MLLLYNTCAVFAAFNITWGALPAAATCLFYARPYGV